MTDLDAFLEKIIAACSCDACERYRRAHRRPGFWSLVRNWLRRSKR